MIFNNGSEEDKLRPEQEFYDEVSDLIEEYNNATVYGLIGALEAVKADMLNWLQAHNQEEEE